MRTPRSLLPAAALALLVALGACAAQAPPAPAIDESTLRSYAGAYEWADHGFLYLQLWAELTGTPQLTAFDESGEVRTLYYTEADSFTAGRGAGIPEPIESRIAFTRDDSGEIVGLSWKRDGAPARTAQRRTIETHEDVQFSNREITLAGTLLKPNTAGAHPAVILVHPSGSIDREYMIPFARFLVRRGVAVLGYDKRGVGGSTGDWRQSSFDDLAGDVVAAFQYLKTRGDIDSAQIGLLGWSQAGWIMPLAAVRAPDLAFLISVSGAGVTPAETTLDQAENEMRAIGMRPAVISQIIELMKLQYAFARTDQGWEEYSAARDQLVARIGRAPETFPSSRDDEYWGFLRRLYFYDPQPMLRRLRVPTLAVFGELDNNILAEKNRAAWDSALHDAGHPDYRLVVLPKANHLLLEAAVGSNAEMPTLSRFAPEYFRIVTNWLAERVRGVSRWD
jgi:uncharacterized protein